MAWIVKIVVWIVCASKRAYARLWVFFAFTAVVFFAFVVILAHFGLLPDSPTQKPIKASKVTLQTSPLVSNESATTRSVKKFVKELPVKIKISKINLAVNVSNPDTTNADRLDKELLSGAVRYPKSAKLGEIGNVIIFGHSSYLPVVYNQAYKTFDGIQKLVKGNHIKVYSDTTIYVYSVDTVSKEDATSATILLAVSRPTLTLSTCDSFGKKSERFIVKAHLVESYPLKS